MRTLEQQIKFDHGLAVGTSLVQFTYGSIVRAALVNIGPRGKVTAFIEPHEGDMYGSWFDIKKDITVSGKGKLEIWPAKNAELMAAFNGPPQAVIAIPTR